jgi:CRISPR system Cascade subunit CasA
VKFSFNLIDEKWIPCTLRDGRAEPLSLRDALVGAHEVLETADASPLVTAALHRLLLAILHRNFGPENESAWEKLWKAGKFDANRLDEYFRKWRDRFDLFDERRPFYQSAAVANAKLSPIAKLAHELASGDNATLFDHTCEAFPAPFAPAEAARHLVAHQCFCPGGTVTRRRGEGPSAAGSPLFKGAIALVRGGNLFQTLMLSLHAYNTSRPFEGRSEDLPAWERDSEPASGKRTPAGYLDLLTWQSRRIWLRPVLVDSTAMVGDAVIMRGSELPEDYSLHAKDPVLAFRRNEKSKEGNPWPVLAFREGRALWRDSLTLFQSVGAESSRPMILDWLNDLATEGIIEYGQTLSLDLLGLASERAKLLFWRHERLPLPLPYLNDTALLAGARQALKCAEQAGRALNKAVWTLAKFLLPAPGAASGARQPQAEEVSRLRDSLSPDGLYWPRLEPFFARFLIDLPPDRSSLEDGTHLYGTRALPAWCTEVRRAASDSLKQITRSLDGSARSLKAVAVAEHSFDADLKRALPADLFTQQEVMDGATQRT